ncbi:MAG: DEAD/DEAH box helicase [Myxococcota bacterium]
MPFQTHPDLLRALTARGYADPTEVQAAVLADEARGRDLLVSARTGSGKTVAFGLALADTILPLGGGPPAALVVAPTRELAMQVRAELAWLYADARVVACVGGMDPRREQRELARGAHVVVGTPGRLCDHLERENLDLSGLKAVVLDEADEMLDLGFRDELERILSAAPTERRTLLFSATVPREIATLAATFQRDALRIATTSGDEPHADIEYRAVTVVPQERENAVVNILRLLDAKGALVFCHTREAVNHLHGNLLERGFSVVVLSGELTQPERTRALQALRDGRARVCVATDVAARGLDLPDLGLVIHADLPREPETLLHRSGRTGRAGKKGVAAVLVPLNRRRQAERLFANARVEPTWSLPPTAEQIRERDDARLAEELAALVAEPAEEDLVVARALLEKHAPEHLAAALVRLKRQQLPSPEEITVPAQAPPRERPPRPPPTEGAWFRVNVGRAEGADPRWVLPMLCRRGRVTKNEIGRIVILQHETRFEVAPPAAQRFADFSRKPDRQEPGIRIGPLRQPPTSRPER